MRSETAPRWWTADRNQAQGGKTVYRARVGILMFDMSDRQFGWSRVARSTHRSLCTDRLIAAHRTEPREASDRLRRGVAHRLRDLRHQRQGFRSLLHRQDRCGTTQAASRQPRHHQRRARPRLPRHTRAMRHRRSRAAAPCRHREGRRCLDRGLSVRLSQRPGYAVARNRQQTPVRS
jgi:hypothetical protein